jgi:predicted dehydrogenase
VLNDANIDTVSIATPDHTHFEPTLALVQAEKNVLVEKPFTTNVKQAVELTRAAGESSAKTMVDFGTRWNPPYMVIKESIMNGKLGKPYMGYSRLSDAIDVAKNWFTWSGDSGPHWFLLPHTMDIMRWYLEEDPIEVYASGARGGAQWFGDRYLGRNTSPC